MYAIFEEVIGPQPSLINKSVHQTPDDEDQGIDVTPGDINTHSKDRTESQYDVSRSRSKRSPGKHQQRIYGSSPFQQHLSSTLPRSGRRRTSSIASSDLDDTASICSSNPLLDTISVLTYDPPDDSDDYYDLTERTGKNGKTSSSNPEGDRDSIGYAGSSSIDSGYKSFCPTPEIPDTSIYGPENGGQTLPYSGFYSDSTSCPQSRNAKPRMGTKVISRQGHASPMRESPGSRRSDASLYDVNLDHLMYLRQSLLSAIQKCESSNPDSLFAPNERRKEEEEEDCSINLVQDQCYTDISTTKPSHPSYTKTVRFNTDVKVTTVNSTDCVSGQDTKSCRTSDASGEQNGPKVQSKSILKDPLCANLRSQLEAGNIDCTLEEEIDSLLYGRAEFYDLENVDDFPCSYVTMIEDKYRSGKPSIAKVRKLKGDKTEEEAPKLEVNSENPPSTEAVTSTDDFRETKSTKESSSSESSSTVLISKQAKCRFTEVARCMLEIIEDLQTKKLQPAGSKDSSATSTGDAPTSAAQNSTSAMSSEDKTENKGHEKKVDSDCYMAAAEYHVYEEIDYDLVNGSVADLKSEVPPPLPARPSVMFMKADLQVYQRKRAPSPPPRKRRCPPKRSTHLNDGPSTEVRNRPKQRGNLYCLFSDRVERRNISRSLEREWRTTGPSDNQEDDYGFKREFPSI